MLLTTVLLLGSAAFAVAVAVESPRNSQIPTVVTSISSTEVPLSAIVTATASSTIASATEKPVVKRSPKGDSDSDPHSSSNTHASDSQREVVTPKVRDNDSEEGGSKGSGSTEDGTSSSGHDSGSKSSGSDSNQPSTSEGSGSKSSSGSSTTHSIYRMRTSRAEVSASVGRHHSSGKNL